MSENHAIRFNIDASGAKKGATEFEGALKRIGAALDKVHNDSKNVFDGLKKPAKMKSFKDFVKQADALSQIRVNPALARNLNDLGVAMAGFRAPNRTQTNNLRQFIKEMNSLSAANSNGATKMANNISTLTGAMSSFRAPNASQIKNLREFTRAMQAMGNARINANSAGAITQMTAAMSGFRAPNASQIKNLNNFIQALGNMRVPQNADAIANALTRISRAATAASQRLSGLRGAGLGGIGGLNPRSLSGMSTGIRGLSGDFRGLENAMSLSYQAGSQLRVILGSLTVGEFSRQIFEAGTAAERFKNVIAVTAGDSAAVGAELDYVREAANRFGIDIKVAYEEYGKFATAARLSGVSLNDTRYVFESFSGAMRVMGLSGERQRLVFLALQQIFSKGTLSAEELKRQLGEQIPGAYEMMQDAIRKATGNMNADLAKMLANGEISSDAVLLLAKEMEKTYGPKVAQAMQRADSQVQLLRNSWTRFKEEVASNGFLDAIADVSARLNQALSGDKMQELARQLGQGLGDLVRMLGDAAIWTAENMDKVVFAVKAFVALQLAKQVSAVLPLFTSFGSLLGGPVTLALAGAAFAATTYWNELVTVGEHTTTVGGILKQVWSDVQAEVTRVFTSVKNYLTEYITGGQQFGESTEQFTQRAAMAWKDWANFAIGAIKNVWDMMIRVGKVLWSFASLTGRSFSSIWQFAEDWDGDAFVKRNQEIVSDTLGIWDEAGANLFETWETNMNTDWVGGWAKRAADEFKSTFEEKVAGWSLRGSSNPEVGSVRPTAPTDINPLTQAGMDKANKDSKEKKKDSYESVVKELREEYQTLQHIGEAREVETKLLQYKNKILEDGNTLTKEQEDNIRNMIRLNAEMEKGGFNGFQRWANGLKSFRESLIEVETNAIDGLSDALTDLVTDGEADFMALGKSILRELNKAVINSLLQDLFKGFEGNSPLASLFGLDAPKGADSASFVQPNGNIETPIANIYANGVSLNGTPLAGGAPLGQGGRVSDYVANPAGYGAPSAPATADVGGFRGTIHDPVGTATAAGTSPGNRVAAGWSHFPETSPGDRVAAGWGMFPEPTTAYAPAAASSGNVVTLTPQDITDLKKTLATEWVTSAGPDQAKGIVDTILNRKASGKWGTSVADVVNARYQFSDINGPPAWKHGRDSVADHPDSMLLSGRGLKSSQLVDSYLAERAAGAPSMVGDHLNYANPYFSDKKNLGWINALEGPVLGKGNAIHRHGTTPDLQGSRPGAYSIALPGQAPGQAPFDGMGGGAPLNAEPLNAAIQQSAQTFQTAFQAPIQTTAQDFGTSMTTPVQTLGTTMQTAVGGAAPAVQQFGAAVQQTTSAAQTAAPAVQQYNANVQSSGTQAQAAAPGLGEFGSGLQGLLGQLMGSFGGQFAGIGQSILGMLFGGFKEGTANTSHGGGRPTRASLSSFAGAPHFAEGTANTGSSGYGGMPAILHPNEAVIPLSRGRKVPVELEGSGPGGQAGGGIRRNVTVNINGVKDFDSFRKSQGQMRAAIAAADQKASRSHN